jgi:hypothetical protein
VEAAAKRTAAAKQQADEVAAHRINAAEAAKREGQAKSRAGEENTTKVAESDLKAAQATRSEGATQRTGRPGREFGRRREAETQGCAGEQL